MNYEVKKVFSQKPMISFRGARKLSSHLVRAKLYRIERTVGSFKCTTKHFEVCKNVNRTYTLLKEQLDHLDVPKSVQSENVNITDSFTSSVTQNTYKISH